MSTPVIATLLAAALAALAPHRAAPAATTPPEASLFSPKPVCPGATGARTAAPARAVPVVKRRGEPACEWCGAAEAPARLGWDVRIARHDEPGEPLVISGRVLRADGRTPAAGVLVYLYHASAAGVYPRRGGESGNGRLHGYLRGWLRTDAQGRYCMATIRPGPYPGRGEPAHIHATLTEPGQPEGYVDEFVFEGDPLVTAAYRAKLRGRGGSGVVRLTRGRDGVWRGERTIVLRDLGR